MADDAAVDADLGFDPSLKKKKKKKVKAFLDGEDGATESTTDGGPADDATTTGDAAAPAEVAPVDAAEDAADLDLDFSMKKKKKKKAVGPTEDAGADEAGAAADGLDEDFMLTKKKKKKKTTKTDLQADDDAGDDEQADKAAWEKENRDYTYSELLERVFEIMRQKNPGMMAGEKKRLVMKPPQVVRIGTKKSAFVNFTEICKMMHRQHDHLLGFLLAELGTSGSVDGSNALVMKGRFLQKQIENVLRRYIREYVTCHTCKSPDTILAKENRLFFLQCEMCGSKCSVASIKSGFQAVTGRRAAIRNKQA